MSYEVKLEIFEGPFDLLLHLIERHQLNIYDIPIALVTEQFLSYIQTMQMMNLAVAGEFLVVAATLMQIKSRMLLPKPPPVTDEEAEEEEDPRADLVERLLEYKKFKDAALELRQREIEFSRFYPRVGGEFPDQVIAPVEDPGGGISLWDLLEAFQVVLDSFTPRHELKGMPKEEISIKERMNEILSRLRLHGKVAFSQLAVGMTTRKALITTFLAILELIRLRSIRAVQDRSFGEIAITTFGEGAMGESQ